MRTLFSWLYAPLFFLGFLAAGLWLVGDGWPLPMLLGLLAVAVLVATLAERLLPYRQEWNASHNDEPRDLLHALVNEGINGLGVITIPLLAFLLPNPGLWPSHWPLWLQLALALPIADLGITLVHFASHRIPLLWRLHSVHHSVQRMYGFNGLMKHPLHQTLEALGGVLPLLLLGLSPQLAALLGFAVGIQLLLQHSNVDMRIGGLRHVFAWAPVHRLHHLKYGRVGDVNFGLFFSVWDRLLGTSLYLPDYRLGDDVGIGDRPDYPVGYVAQCVEPFRVQRKQEAAVVPQDLRQALGPRQPS